MSSGASEAKSYTLACLDECQPDVRAIFKRVLSVVFLNLSPIPAQALNEEDSRLKCLLKGLFPVITEELYHAVKSENADKCSEIVSSAEQHVHGRVQAWRCEAIEEGLYLRQLLLRKLVRQGLEPSELPEEVQSAIDNISAQMEADPADKTSGDLMRQGFDYYISKYLPENFKENRSYAGKPHTYAYNDAFEEFDLRSKNRMEYPEGCVMGGMEDIDFARISLGGCPPYEGRVEDRDISAPLAICPLSEVDMYGNIKAFLELQT